MTQKQIGGLVGVSRQTMVELEKGDYNPSLALALRIAVVLDASVHDLFTLEPEETSMLTAAAARATGQSSQATTEEPKANGDGAVRQRPGVRA